MRDPAAERMIIIEQLENTLAVATELHQYVLAYLIENAIAEAWTSGFPSIGQLPAARVPRDAAP